MGPSTGLKFRLLISSHNQALSYIKLWGRPASDYRCWTKVIGWGRRKNEVLEQHSPCWYSSMAGGENGEDVSPAGRWRPSHGRHWEPVQAPGRGWLGWWESSWMHRAGPSRGRGCWGANSTHVAPAWVTEGLTIPGGQLTQEVLHLLSLESLSNDKECYT